MENGKLLNTDPPRTDELELELLELELEELLELPFPVFLNNIDPSHIATLWIRRAEIRIHLSIVSGEAKRQRALTQLDVFYAKAGIVSLTARKLAFNTAHFAVNIGGACYCGFATMEAKRH